MAKEICNDSFKQERGTIYQFFDVHEHDVKVLFGDLNFRLQPDYVDQEKIHGLIAEGNYNELLKRDDYYLFKDKD